MSAVEERTAEKRHLDDENEVSAKEARLEKNGKEEVEVIGEKKVVKEVPEGEEEVEDEEADDEEAHDESSEGEGEGSEGEGEEEGDDSGEEEEGDEAEGGEESD